MGCYALIVNKNVKNYGKSKEIHHWFKIVCSEVP